MSEQEVLDLWKSGISKHKIANIYKQRFNQQVKVIRAEVVNKYKIRYISNYRKTGKESIKKYKKIWIASD